jgi:hypothetical protein
LPRLVKLLLILAITTLALAVASAQNITQLQPGDPPLASLIQVSPPNENGMVTIAGAPGSVFPSAQVAIRNLYTGDTAYVQAGVTGSFTTTLYGAGNTPYWISPAENIPNNMRNRPGSLPGGPGTIIYGAFPQIPLQTTSVTQLVVDGDLSDWRAYDGIGFVTETEPLVYALLNQQSMYVAIDQAPPDDYAQMVVRFSLEGVVYDLAFDPRQMQPGSLKRVEPLVADLGTLPLAVSIGDGIEVRFPVRGINLSNPTIDIAGVEAIYFTGTDGTNLVEIDVRQRIPILGETDGIVRLNSQDGQEVTRFIIAGTIAGGATRWTARGRVNSLNLQPGDTLVLELDVTMNTPELADGLTGLSLGGALRLQPIVGADGAQAAGGIGSNNGWSNVLTPSGLGIVNLRSDFQLAQTMTPSQQVIRQGDNLVFPITFEVTLPENLPAGLYVPLFQGIGQVGDGETFFWSQSSVLGTGAGDDTLERLPLVFKVGEVNNPRLLWTLFQDNPSNGTRGLIAEQDRSNYASADRVHFDNPTYILPPYNGADGQPITYPIEPYLLMEMPNTYHASSAPLIPIFFPGGRLSARITRPDGEVDDLGSSAIFQNRLSTAALDERQLFGAQSPTDVYRLTTLNSAFTNYTFTQYGEYQIDLTGNIEDVWGNRYEGGGTYHVLIAEPLSILPGVLPGTPFEVGDHFQAGLSLSPGAPADVTITARIYPLNGGKVIEHVIQGTADPGGYFFAEGFDFDVPGEYVIDYEARYTDADGQLWAGSLRGAGVIATPEDGLIAHGARGLDNYPAEMRPAWFNIRQYLAGTNLLPRLNYPYHSGDVAWLDQSADGQMNPIIQVQDTTGEYTEWLATNMPDYVSPNGVPLDRLALEGELPLASFKPDDEINAYSYISAVAPGLSVRQFVQGGLDGGLSTAWDNDDPLNGQAGAGLNGAQTGDFMFLFGGAVVRDGIDDTAIYGGLAVVIDNRNDPRGTRVYPPYRGEAGGPNGGPLLTVRGQTVNMFFHPTGIRPGDVLTVGDTLSVAGQVAPTLASIVSVKITSPNGVEQEFEGVANAVGYFHDPAHDFQVNEPGVWTVQINVRHEGETSAGQIEPPPPTGGVLGASGGQFQVFVVPADGARLNWNTANDQSFAAGIPFNFNFELPTDWSNIRVYKVVKTPSYILDDAPIRPTGVSFSFQYNPTNLSKDFPNLENNGDGNGASAADVVTLTFAATGVNADGQLQIQTRTFTIAHDRLTTFG